MVPIFNDAMGFEGVIGTSLLWPLSVVKANPVPGHT